MNVILNGHIHCKTEWRRIVWQTIWQWEDEDCMIIYKQPEPDIILFNMVENAYYLVWWLISDMMPERMNMCELLAAIVCDTSLIKATDYRLKKKTFRFKMRNMCDLGILENARHIIMQCPFYSEERASMFMEIEGMCNIRNDKIRKQEYDIMHILLRKQPVDTTFEEMLQLWLISGKYISNIYRCIVTGRK